MFLLYFIFSFLVINSYIEFILILIIFSLFLMKAFGTSIVIFVFRAG